MNKTRHPMAAQIRKKMKKAVRNSSIQPDPILKSDSITPQTLLSRVPAKLRAGKKAILNSFERNIEAKRAKARAHNSKRTTPGSPGTLDQESATHISHVEGGRWIKTLTKQNNAKRKVMTRHMAKKK